LHTAFNKDDVFQHLYNDVEEQNAAFADKAGMLKWLNGGHYSTDLDTWTMVYICGEVDWGAPLKERFR
jgi:hypothetical protein